MIVDIVGSRNYTDYKQFKTFLQDALKTWPDVIEVVSGGAQGADAMAERWARENNIPIKIFKPDWVKFGKAAGPIRNQQIIEYASHVIAFPSKTGKGTQDSIVRATKLKRELIICPID